MTPCPIIAELGSKIIEKELGRAETRATGIPITINAEYM